MATWLPIGTAPKDTPVLIWDGKMMATAEHYSGLSTTKNPYIYWRIVGASGYECEEDFKDPTHWMPLPEPPL